MVQWKQELLTVDERVRTIVGVKDKACKLKTKTWLVNKCLKACWFIFDDIFCIISYYTFFSCDCRRAGCESAQSY